MRWAQVMAIRVWLGGGVTGLGTGLSFILVSRALSTDLQFHLWEFAMALIPPALVAVVVARTLKTNVIISLLVAYATLMVPTMGPAFGGTGSEHPILFAGLGLVGGLVWSVPFALWALIMRRKST